MTSESKLPGKTPWAGRRRPVTRVSGFNASAAVRMRIESVPAVSLEAGDEVHVKFTIPDCHAGDRIGFGLWFSTSSATHIHIVGDPGRTLLRAHALPAWGKLGSQWLAQEPGDLTLTVIFHATTQTSLALFEPGCGHVSHDGIKSARPELLANLDAYAPEGNFYPDDDGTVDIAVVGHCTLDHETPIALKSCNRCGRFLPVNLPPYERATLSFSNHCVARAPCRHPSFGRIQDADDPSVIHAMHFGFQLECRYCKKFYVNAALNPQRTAGQMKEDAARRRAFEVLLEHLYGGSPQLEFKNRTGMDLAAVVFTRFGGKCFKCKQPFANQREMHLDHTRPLALLWPLDEHATALCARHNSEKRDRPPADFYTRRELVDLAILTDLDPAALEDPTPNVDAVNLLGENLDWFFDDFIPGEGLTRVREGKAAAGLLVKALQKAIDRVPGGPPYDLIEEARRRGVL